MPWDSFVTKFSPDGRHIVSGSWDSTIRIWDAAAGALVATLMAARDGEWVAVTPAGFFAASDKGSEMLAVVRGLESYPMLRLHNQLHRPDLIKELLKGDPQGKYQDEVRKLNLESILHSAPPR